MLRHLDLFSGIGGFALAARMVGGYETVAFCEIDPYCQAVLRKHWPHVPIYDDIRSIPRMSCDVVTGGFPCQPVSRAGKRLGASDDRWLWPAMRDCIRESEPTWVLGENVVDLDGLGLDEAIDDLEGIGYEVAPPLEVPACGVGADHERNRVWLIAHSQRNSLQGRATEAAEGTQRAQQLSGFLFPSVRDAVSAARVWRASNGVSGRMDVRRNMAVGNAIVWQVAAIFLQAIKECEEAQAKVGCEAGSAERV